MAAASSYRHRGHTAPRVVDSRSSAMSRGMEDFDDDATMVGVAYEEEEATRVAFPSDRPRSDVAPKQVSPAQLRKRTHLIDSGESTIVGSVEELEARRRPQTLLPRVPNANEIAPPR